MRNFLKKIMYNYIGLIFKILSVKNYFFSLFESEIIVKSVKKNESKYCIFVFYQNDVRDDVISILKELKDQEVSVILISNKKLLESQIRVLDLYTDIIISRPNFGRDFGAYKRGVGYLYKHIDLSNIKRLVFLNDSVFYSSRGLEGFVKDLLNEEFSVIGATENLEVKQHIGSFCISVSGNIVRDYRFKRYWKNYKNSDVRPTVISRGEMGLSKILFKITGESSRKILYDSKIIYDSWKNKNIDIHNIFSLIRNSEEPSTWKTINFKALVSNFIEEKALPINNNVLFKKNTRSILSNSDNESNFCVSNTGALGLLKKYSIDIESLDYEFDDYILSRLLELSMSGSQIHQNNILFYFMGMPIIKNDCFFRGVFNQKDLYSIISFLPENERDNFLKIQMSKPYGKEFLKDTFEYYAYMCGYL